MKQPAFNNRYTGNFIKKTCFVLSFIFILAGGSVWAKDRFHPADTYRYEFHEGLSPYYDWGKDKYGYIDITGKIVIPAVYYKCEPFSEGLALVYKTQEELFYIDRLGNEVIDFQKLSYTGYKRFKEGFAPIRNGVYKSYIDKSGAIVLTVDCYELNEFNNGLAVFSAHLKIRNNTHKRFGAIDKTGKVVIPPDYIYIRDFSEGLAFAIYYDVITELSTPMIIDVTGRKVFDGVRDIDSNFHEGLFKQVLVKKGELPEFFYLDKTGKTVLTVKNYDDAGEFYNGLARVGKKINGKMLYGYIDKSGREIIKLQYRDAANFSEGAAAVSVKDKIGFIDTSGKYLIKPSFDPTQQWKY